MYKSICKTNSQKWWEDICDYNFDTYCLIAFLLDLYQFTLPPECLKVPVSLQLEQQSELSFFLDFYQSDRLTMIFQCILNCISLPVSESEHLFFKRLLSFLFSKLFIFFACFLFGCYLSHQFLGAFSIFRRLHFYEWVFCLYL